MGGTQRLELILSRCFAFAQDGLYSGMGQSPSISIIIPTLNEDKCIAALLDRLRLLDGQQFLKEVIVCDGSSSDETATLAKAKQAMVIVSAQRQRAYQMNLGAKIASGSILYFLHADSVPSADTLLLIQENVKRGFSSGCFRLRFNYPHWFLRTQAWFTRFPQTIFRFGDQSLFVTKEIFDAIGGYNEKLFLMEDQEIIYRIKEKGRFVVLPQHIVTSSRKYLANGIYRLQLIFYTIYVLYHLGFSQAKLRSLYLKWIKPG